MPSSSSFVIPSENDLPENQQVRTGGFLILGRSAPHREGEQQFKLTYSDSFVIVENPFSPFGPVFTLLLIEPEFYVGTNLNLAYFHYRLSDSPQDFGGCFHLFDPTESGEGEVVVNDIVYTIRNEVSTGYGGGPDNRIEYTSYTTVFGGMCYEVIFYLHSNIIYNDDTGLGEEFDAEGIFAKMWQTFEGLELLAE